MLTNLEFIVPTIVTITLTITLTKPHKNIIWGVASIWPKMARMGSPPLN